MYTLYIWLPVPLIAIMLFAVIASQISRLYHDVILLTEVLPIYVLFVLITPFIAYALALFPLDIPAGRALTFSMSTRNSLAVLPLAFTLPAQPAPLVVAVIITQTIIELFAEIIYIRIIPTWLVT